MDQSDLGKHQLDLLETLVKQCGGDGNKLGTAWVGDYLQTTATGRANTLEVNFSVLTEEEQQALRHRTKRGKVFRLCLTYETDLP